MQRYEQYIGLIVAFVALLVAIYAVTTQQKPYQPPPTASATVRLTDNVVVDVPGIYSVNLGWIYVKDAPAVVQLTSNYTHIWFLLDGKMYGNAVNALLAPGNHTVSAVIAIYGNGTKINIDYKVVG